MSEYGRECACACECAYVRLAPAGRSACGRVSVRLSEQKTIGPYGVGRPPPPHPRYTPLHSLPSIATPYWYPIFYNPPVHSLSIVCADDTARLGRMYLGIAKNPVGGIFVDGGDALYIFHKDLGVLRFPTLGLVGGAIPHLGTSCHAVDEGESPLSTISRRSLCG